MKTSSEFVLENIQYFLTKFDFFNATSEENEVYLAYKDDEVMNTSEGKALLSNDVAAKRIYSLMFEIPFDSKYFYIDIVKASALSHFRMKYPSSLLKDLVIEMYKENN